MYSIVLLWTARFILYILRFCWSAAALRALSYLKHQSSAITAVSFIHFKASSSALQFEKRVCNIEPFFMSLMKYRITHLDFIENRRCSTASAKLHYVRQVMHLYLWYLQGNMARLLITIALTSHLLHFFHVLQSLIMLFHKTSYTFSNSFMAIALSAPLASVRQCASIKIPTFLFDNTQALKHSWILHLFL